MKKFRFISGLAIIVMSSIILTINSCSKQEESIKNSDNSVSEKDYTIYNQISSFVEKMSYYKENTMFKSGESIEIDEALWLMEGAMNLTYGFPFEEYGEYTSGESVISLQKNEAGEINMDEVAVKYQQLIEDAREDYYNSGFEDKGLYVVNLEKGDEDNGKVTFNVKTVTGNKGVDPWPFEQGDDWWYGELGGGCNGNTQPGHDAAHELAGIYPAYNITYCMALSGLKSVEVKGGADWLRRPYDLEDNLNDYYIFCMKDNITPFNYNDDMCLLSNEMSAYYWFMDYVITDLARLQFSVPEEYVFIGFDYIEGNAEFIQEEEYTKYFHYFDLLYGLPYYKPNCDSPIEL